MHRARKPPKPLERVVQKQCIQYLELLGWTVHRRNTGAMTAVHKGKTRFIRFSEPGQSDTFGTLPDGRHFELEFKRPGNRPTDLQLHWIRKHNSIHSVGFWVADLDSLRYVAPRLMAGGRIAWGEDDRYDVVDFGELR